MSHILTSYIYVSIYICLIYTYLYFTPQDPCHVTKKKAIRIINNASHTHHTYPLSYPNRLHKLQDMYKFNLRIYARENIE